jgi:hypothetical protein
LQRFIPDGLKGALRLHPADIADTAAAICQDITQIVAGIG